MAESVNVTDAVLGKKMEGFAWNENNFVAENELTITITLAEYRELIEAKATKRYDIDKANEDKYKRDNENKALKSEVEELRARLFELSCRDRATRVEPVLREVDLDG